MVLVCHCRRTHRAHEPERWNQDSVLTTARLEGYARFRDKVVRNHLAEMITGQFALSLDCYRQIGCRKTGAF